MTRDTTPTDRRGYDRPAVGDDWAAAWDELVEDTDELVVERGPVADRPSTGAYDDALYLAVDQRTVWRWDAAASDWEAVSGLGTAADPVPGTSHFESLNTDSINNVADVVLKDGDDIQSELSNLSKGDTVVFPDEQQVLEQTITISTKETTILNATTKQADGANIEQFRLTADNIEMLNFVTDGNKANNTTTSPDRKDNIVVTGGCQGVRVAHGECRDATRHGIRVTGEDGSVFEATVEDIIGNDNQRDVVSIEGRGTNRNPTARDIRGNFSVDRGTLEVTDGVDNATVENIFGRGQWYVVDVQDHDQAGHDNYNTTVETVRGESVTFTVRSGTTGTVTHKRTTIRDAKGDGKIQLFDTDYGVIDDCVVVDTETAESAFEVFNCNFPRVMNCRLTFDEGTPASALNGIFLGVTRDNDYNGASITECDMSKADNAKIRIRNISTSGTLTDYIVTHNHAFIQNDVSDGNSLVEKNISP